MLKNKNYRPTRRLDLKAQCFNAELIELEKACSKGKSAGDPIEYEIKVEAYLSKVGSNIIGKILCCKYFPFLISTTFMDDERLAVFSSHL